MKTINSRAYALILAIGAAVTLLFIAYLYFSNAYRRQALIKPQPPVAQEALQKPENNVDAISYTQSIEAGEKSGEYRFVLKLTNKAAPKANELPNILVDFLTIEGEPGHKNGRRIIPTAIYRATEYAPQETGREFSEHQLSLDIKVPEGTQMVASCLTYAGPEDMDANRCANKINEEINRPIQGTAQ